MRSKNEEIEILTDFIIENLLDDFNLGNFLPSFIIFRV